MGKFKAIVLVLALLTSNFQAISQQQSPKDTAKVNVPLDRFYNKYDFEGEVGYLAYTDSKGQVKYVSTDTTKPIPPDEMNDFIKSELTKLRFHNLPNKCIYVSLKIKKGSQPPQGKTQKS